MSKVLRVSRPPYRVVRGIFMKPDGETFTNAIAEAGVFEAGVDYSELSWTEWEVSAIVSSAEYDLAELVGMAANPLLALSTLHHHRPDVTEPPWADLDPGIVGVVRSLWNEGFWTTDSGDGRHKLETLGYDDESITHFPHVVVRTPYGGAQAEAERFLKWAERHGFEGSSPEADGLELQLFPAASTEPRFPYDWLILVGCPQFYGWSEPEGGSR